MVFVILTGGIITGREQERGWKDAGDVLFLDVGASYMVWLLGQNLPMRIFMIYTCFNMNSILL